MYVGHVTDVRSKGFRFNCGACIVYWCCFDVL